MNNIEWPLNEPIETNYQTLTATVLFRDDKGSMSGYIEETKDGVRHAASWAFTGEREGNDRGSLIPPKPKVRTATIYYDWTVGSAWNGADPAYRTPHTITHPDDVKPITREALKKFIDEIWSCDLYKEVLPSIVALLKEHGVSVDE